MHLITDPILILETNLHKTPLLLVLMGCHLHALLSNAQPLSDLRGRRIKGRLDLRRNYWCMNTEQEWEKEGAPSLGCGWLDLLIFTSYVPSHKLASAIVTLDCWLHNSIHITSEICAVGRLWIIQQRWLKIAWGGLLLSWKYLAKCDGLFAVSICHNVTG